MTDRQAAFGLAALLFVVFNLNLRAIPSQDTRVIQLTALSLAVSLDATLDEFPDVGRSDGVQVRDGRVLPNYPVVPALVAAPFYAVAVAAGVIDAERPASAGLEGVGKIAASALTAVACAFLYLIVRGRFPAAPASLVVTAAALSSPWWSAASQALWSHAAAACFLACAFLLSASVDRSRAAAIVAGSAISLAVTSRLLLLPFAVGLLVLARRSPHRWSLAVATVVPLAALLAWQQVTFGHLLGGAAALESAATHGSTHQVAGAWTTSVLRGALGILISPNRGMLIFMPLVLWTGSGALRLWRSADGRWLVVAPTLAYLAGWSGYAVWWGGHSYGPRYATDIVIPLSLMACAAIHGTPPLRDLVRRAAAVALAWGIVVQAIGVFCYPGGAWNTEPVNVDQAHWRLWDWRDLQIVRTARAGLYTRHLPRLLGDGGAQ
jgi:hypothetical protein